MFMNPVQVIKRLRIGEKVLCPQCNSGTVIPVGNREKTNCFHCEKCTFKIIVN